MCLVPHIEVGQVMICPCKRRIYQLQRCRNTNKRRYMICQCICVKIPVEFDVSTQIDNVCIQAQIANQTPR